MSTVDAPAPAAPPAEPPVPPERPAWKRPWLGGDGARGLGALLVFVSHIATAEFTFRGAGFPDMPGRDLYELFGGEVGWRTFFAPARLVNLFFAFSAYLLARPFIAWALNRTKRPGTVKFYVRRVLRIMPAYWVVVLLVLLWLVVLRDDHATSAKEVLKVVFLLDGGLRDAGFHASWTIPIETAWTVRVEVLGYLVLPILAWAWFWAGRRFGMRGMVVSVAALLAFTLAVRLISNPALSGPGLLQWLFLPGLTVALVEAHEPVRRWFAARSRTATMWALLVSFLLLCGSEPVSARLITHLVENLDLPPLPPTATAADVLARGQEVSGALRWGAVVAIPMQFLGATGMLLCFIALEWQGGKPPLGLGRRIPRWFGERSYSFYLVHFAVIALLLPVVWPSQTSYPGLIALGLASFVVSLALTVVLFRWVEMPGMLLASRLTGRRPPGPLAVSAPEAAQAWRAEAAAIEARRDGAGGPGSGPTTDGGGATDDRAAADGDDPRRGG